MRDQFVKLVNSATMDLIQLEGLGEYKADERIVQVLSDVVVRLHDYYKEGS